MPKLMVASASQQPSLPEPQGSEMLKLSEPSAKIGRAITSTSAGARQHELSEKQKAQIARVALLKSKGYA